MSYKGFYNYSQQSQVCPQQSLERFVLLREPVLSSGHELR